MLIKKLVLLPLEHDKIFRIRSILLKQELSTFKSTKQKQKMRCMADCLKYHKRDSYLSSSKLYYYVPLYHSHFNQNFCDVFSLQFCQKIKERESEKVSDLTKNSLRLYRHNEWLISKKDCDKHCRR